VFGMKVSGLSAITFISSHPWAVLFCLSPRGCLALATITSAIDKGATQLGTTEKETNSSDGGTSSRRQSKTSTTCGLTPNESQRAGMGLLHHRQDSLESGRIRHSQGGRRAINASLLLQA